MSESDKSGKPELTAEDKERIDAWIKPRILTLTHCATDWEFAQEAAEYATLHERSAAQARIAELEAALNEFLELTREGYEMDALIWALRNIVIEVVRK